MNIVSIFVREVLKSNLGRVIGYPDRVFCGFAKCLHVNFGQIPLKRLQSLPSHYDIWYIVETSSLNNVRTDLSQCWSDCLMDGKTCSEKRNNRWRALYVCKTKWLTPRGRTFLEKLLIIQLVKKFPTSYGTLRSVTMLRSARHCSLSWARWMQ